MLTKKHSRVLVEKITLSSHLPRLFVVVSAKKQAQQEAEIFLCSNIIPQKTKQKKHPNPKRALFLKKSNEKFYKCAALLLNAARNL